MAPGLDLELAPGNRLATLLIGNTAQPMNRKLIFLLLMVPAITLAHDPIFGLGPHVLYKNGVEAALDWHGVENAGMNSETGLELTYGITGDWAAGLELPLDEDASLNEAAWFSKYRFWRKDSLGVQQSAAVLLRHEGNREQPGWVTGLAWGYESRRHYRWASLRYRKAETNDAGLRAGDGWKLDLVAGYRPWLTGYLQPDTVFMVELNGERQARARFHGQTVSGSGGQRLFISPGIFWTLRNFAVKAGVQLPLAQDMNNPALEIDYRARLTLEWHY